MTAGLQTRSLAKSFGGRRAVDGLFLDVRAGETYALLGPNGAGKTTALKMITGLLEPDAGEISIFGIDARAAPQEAKRIMAWLPDEPLIYERLTPWEHLDFVAGLWGLPPREAEGRAEALLRRLDLWEVRHERCGGFSRGMKQKTVLAAALLHEPRLLLLDEPLTGLDALVAREVKDILRELTLEGASLVLTTHILEVAERMADRIGIIQQGRLLAEGSLDDLRAQAGRRGASLEDVFVALTRDAELASP